MRIHALPEHLSQLTKAAIFGRYSRAEGGFDEIIAGLTNEGAVQFHARIFAEYGHESVAELASAHLACEGVSMRAALALTDNRIGISPLMKSSRYVTYRKDEDGRWPYIPNEHNAACDSLFEAYHEVRKRVRSELTRRHGDGTQAMKRAIHAASLDAARGLLPLETLTNVGLHGNARAFERLIIKLKASDDPELHAIADGIMTALEPVFGPLLGRLRTERGAQMIADEKAVVAFQKTPRPPLHNSANVTMMHSFIEYDVNAPILFPVRSARHTRIPRMFEHIFFRVRVGCDIGTYRDLQRHRCLSPYPVNTRDVMHFHVPHTIHEVGCCEMYQDVIKAAAPVATLSHIIEWGFTANLRAISHLCELRSQPQGHIYYRQIAHNIARGVLDYAPWAAPAFQFVDWTERYDLPRLAAELRKESRLTP